MINLKQSHSATSTHFTRSSVSTQWKSAGVLPLAYHSGQAVVLLGAELVKTGPEGKLWRCMWKDFGGNREAIDEDAEATAGREFAEETLGMFGGAGVNASSVAQSAAQMATQLRERRNAMEVVHTLKRGEYHMFVAVTSYVDPLMLDLASQQNACTGAVDGAEKSAFAWVALSELLKAVEVCGKRYHLCSRTGPGAGRHRPGGRLRRMQLHPCFASSIRMAAGPVLDGLLAQLSCSPHTHTWPSLLLSQQPLRLRGACQGEDADPSSNATQATHVVQVLSPSPEHMLYWVLQEDVAAQLRRGSHSPGQALGQVPAQSDVDLVGNGLAALSDAGKCCARESMPSPSGGKRHRSD